MIQMKTKERGKSFAYKKDANGDIIIEYGEGPWRASIQKFEYERLIKTFRGRTVMLGTSRDNPPPDSLGEWLQQTVIKTAVASYLGPILVREGHADWQGTRKLKFHA